jgi:hypothetical protein
MQKEKYLPNVRRLFRPDPGYVIVDIDLSGADAAVVAWEAEDRELKDAFIRGEKLHSKNYELLCDKKFDPARDKRVKPPGWNFPPYDAMKRFVHATNYGASARTIATTLGWRVADAESRQNRWFGLHPGIRQWQDRTGFNLQTKRTATNRFGHRIVYLDRPDALLPQALAWIPQSTVGILCARGGVRIFRQLPFINILLQAHDALIFQCPIAKWNPSTLDKIKELVSIPINYPDPLTIPWSIAMCDKSWADCQPIDWQGNKK